MRRTKNGIVRIPFFIVSTKYQLFFKSAYGNLKITMVNADTTTKEHSEQSERMRHFVV